MYKCATQCETVKIKSFRNGIIEITIKAGIMMWHSAKAKNLPDKTVTAI